MSIMETLNTRRTYRRFAQKPVPQDVVDDMVQNEQAQCRHKEAYSR